jgi:hypothetical protein
MELPNGLSPRWRLTQLRAQGFWFGSFNITPF